VVTPNLFFAVLLALTIVGLFAVLVVWRSWESVSGIVTDLRAKYSARAIQLLSGSVSVMGAYEAAHKEDWWLPAITGVVCVVVWEVLKDVVDSKVKAADKLDKAALARAEAESKSRTELLTVFRRSVTDKTKRLMGKLAKRTDRVSVMLVRSALTPDDHLDSLLQALAVFFHEQRPADSAETTNFRVGLYALSNGVMEPLRAVNLNNPSYDVFSAYRAHKASFVLDAKEKPSHTVTCVNQRQTIIVEDCVASAAKGEFHFFHDNQRGYLRSILAYYLDQVCCEDGTLAVAALVIDTDLAGFFRDAERESLEYSLREFGARLKLELLLHSMLLTRGAN
jgi:hypothetical protein